MTIILFLWLWSKRARRTPLTQSAVCFTVLAASNSQRRVAFLPLVPIKLKGLKPKDWLDEPTTIGEHLRKQRKLRGLLQKDVAAQIGCSTDSYRGWEQDRIRPSAASWAAIVRFLGFAPSRPPITLGERLKAKRRALGWSERQAADYFGWDDTTLYRCERGLRAPTGKRLQQVNAFLDPKTVDGSNCIKRTRTTVRGNGS